jgi:hypothetical protein
MTLNKTSTRIGILQPGYLPWLGFFEQIYKADIFVIYDDVQYDKNSWRNRNRIKTPQGLMWVTVPVLMKFGERLPVNRIAIDNKADWRKKHLLSIKYNYAKAPFYKDCIGIFEEAYGRGWEYLIDIDMFFIYKIVEYLGMDKNKIVLASTLNIEGDRIGRLVNICRYFNADIFYEGAAGKDYLSEKDFAEHGIRLEFQDYKHPVYKQLYGEFVPQLSIVDLLFNHGKESLGILINNKFDGIIK